MGLSSSSVSRRIFRHAAIRLPALLPPSAYLAIRSRYVRSFGVGGPRRDRRESNGTEFGAEPDVIYRFET